MNNNGLDSFKKTASLLARNATTLFVLGSLSLLSACGGGGGGGGGSAPSPAVSATSTSSSKTSTSVSASASAPTSAPTSSATVNPTVAAAPPVIAVSTPSPVAADPVEAESLKKAEPTAAYVLPPGARDLVQPALEDASDALSEQSQLLIDCVILLTQEAGCSLDTLPLIGMLTEDPSIDEIMQRVLVSHPWMGSRFREVLEKMPAEMLLMMRGVTAIVISYDIRPSKYSIYSGAIYLDPNVMWLTREERDVIDDTPDFRSGYGAELQFDFLRRYVISNTDIQSLPRDIDTISLSTASLLFHLLAHANNLISPADIDLLDRFLPIHLALTGVSTSSRLSATYPLQSSTLEALAAVSFLGELSSAVQQESTAADLGAQFAADYASDYFNYTSEFEDFAMIFEEAMMFHSFGVQKDVAFTQAGGSRCGDYIVEWGQRNRLADPAVQARANFVVAELLPEYAAAVENTLASMPGVVSMTTGLSWCSNINLNVASTSASINNGSVDVDDAPVEALPSEG